MNRFFILILISLFTGINAQQSKNRFEEEGQSGFERQVDHTNDTKANNTQLNPGNPGDPVPIDNYIPFLAITAVGIILYSTRTKKKLLS